MDILTIIVTTINVCFTLISVTCAVVSVKQTHKQTEIMQKQLEHDLEPDYALASKLENISKAIYSIGSTIRDTATKSK